MRTPTRRSGPATTPVAPRSGRATRRVGVTVLGGAAGGAATISARNLVGAPWWVVAVAVVLSIVVSGSILLAQVLIPDDSEHKRDLWLAGLRYWDRRSQRKRTGQTRQ